jgi:hypothetical protein
MKTYEKINLKQKNKKLIFLKILLKYRKKKQSLRLHLLRQIYLVAHRVLIICS